jgi:thiol-disulfide isomerase/thioredoxin
LYDADRHVLATFPDRTDSSAVYLAFLNTGAGAGAPPAPAATAGLEFSPFKTLEGAPISPTAWAGKAAVINYWATWCIPCRQEIPEFNKMAAELGPKGVEIVGISMDEEGAEPVKEFLKQNAMKYTIGLGTGTPGQLPITVVIDKAGKTVQRFEGFTKPEAIRAAIDKALGS